MEWCFCSQTGHIYLLMPLISKIAKYMILTLNHNYLRLGPLYWCSLTYHSSQFILPKMIYLHISLHIILSCTSVLLPHCHCLSQALRWFLSSYSALLSLLFCSFMPQSFDPLSGLSPHRCFVLHGVKGCCYLRLAGLASAVLGRRAEWDRSYQHSEPLPSVNTSVSSSLAPHANYTLIARLEHSPIRMGPFWN